MKNKFLIILFILIIITVVVGYVVYTYRTNVFETQKINKQYESYYDIDILGTELVSIINKTMDINEKHQISKDENNTYIENNNNSIKIYIVFNYKDKTKTVAMENIYNGGEDAFIKTYSTANFKCTSIEYHQKTNNVKSLTFTEIAENEL